MEILTGATEVHTSARRSDFTAGRVRCLERCLSDRSCTTPIRMQVEIAIDGADAIAVRSLEKMLTGHNDLRGLVRPLIPVPRSGAMGSPIETLLVTVGQGGAGAAVASVLISWIRRRTGAVTLKLTRPDGGEASVEAQHVKNLTPEELRSLVTQLQGVLDHGATEK